jgi:hypothetical protein
MLSNFILKNSIIGDQEQNVLKKLNENPQLIVIEDLFEIKNPKEFQIWFSIWMIREIIKDQTWYYKHRARCNKYMKNYRKRLKSHQ